MMLLIISFFSVSTMQSGGVYPTSKMIVVNYFKVA